MRGELGDATFIRTFSGKYFWPFEPRAEDVCIEDIAHSLANQCRWTGHVRQFYSVAQHSCLMSDNVSPENKLYGLLHDASEAYLTDLARPVKHAPGLGEIYRQVEKGIERVICEKFNLPLVMPAEVKAMDNVLLHTEKRDLMAGDCKELLAEEPKYLPEKIDPWSPALAEHLFLVRYYALTGLTWESTIGWRLVSKDKLDDGSGSANSGRTNPKVVVEGDSTSGGGGRG